MPFCKYFPFSQESQTPIEVHVLHPGLHGLLQLVMSVHVAHLVLSQNLHFSDFTKYCGLQLEQTLEALH